MAGRFLARRICLNDLQYFEMICVPFCLLQGLDAIILRPAYDEDFHDPAFPEFTESEIQAIHSLVNRRAVFLSDNSLWADPGVGDRPIDFGDNLLLLTNAIAWIAEGGGGLFLGDGAPSRIINNFNELAGHYGVNFHTTCSIQKAEQSVAFRSMKLRATSPRLALTFTFPCLSIRRQWTWLAWVLANRSSHPGRSRNQPPAH